MFCANQFSKMIIKTQDECRSVALRNFERKQTSFESSSKAQSPRSSRSEWCCQIMVVKVEFMVI